MDHATDLTVRFRDNTALTPIVFSPKVKSSKIGSPFHVPNKSLPAAFRRANKGVL